MHICILININIAYLLPGHQQVPGLYKLEELEPILTPLKNAAAQEGFVGSPASFFSERKYILCP